MLLTKPKTFLTALVTGGLVWATASFAENITVTDMAGRTVDVPHGAERIILGEGRMMYAVAPLMTKDPFKRILGWCRVALKWGHPQFVWCRGSIRALSKFGPARPYIARFKVFNRLIWPSA